MFKKSNGQGEGGTTGKSQEKFQESDGWHSHDFLLPCITVEEFNDFYVFNRISTILALHSKYLQRYSYIVEIS